MLHVTKLSDLHGFNFAERRVVSSRCLGNSQLHRGSFNEFTTRSVRARASHPDPGNTPGKALKISSFQGKRVFRDTISSIDRNDYYRIKLTETSNLVVRRNPSGDALITVLDRKQRLLKGDHFSDFALLGYTPTSIFQGIKPGIYYVQVTFNPPRTTTPFPQNTFTSSYRLTLSITK